MIKQYETVPPFLKRFVLGLQLLGHLHGICAQTVAVSEPLLVRLGKGQAVRTISADLQRIIQTLHLDPDLNPGPLLDPDPNLKRKNARITGKGTS